VTLQPGDRLVINASVAVKWVVPSSTATTPRLCSTTRWWRPTCSSPSAPMSSGRKCVSKDEADIAAQTLEQAEIAIASTRSHLASAMAIAVELDHPAHGGVSFRCPSSRVATPDRGRQAHSEDPGRSEPLPAHAGCAHGNSVTSSLPSWMPPNPTERRIQSAPS